MARPMERSLHGMQFIKHTKLRVPGIPAEANPSTDIFKLVFNRQLGHISHRPESVVQKYIGRHLPELLKEKEFDLGSTNKVFAAEWVSDRQVVFGTKCNAIYVLDIYTKQMALIPSLMSSGRFSEAENPCGIHGISVNPSGTLLATGALYTNDVAVYQLPTFDPVCVGENGHTDWIFDITFLDDQFFATGSRDNKVSLWRVDDDADLAYSMPTYCRKLGHRTMMPLASKNCEKAEKIRALAVNHNLKELASLSLNGTLHLWDVEKFRQKSCKKLRHARENVCISSSEEMSVYAVGSQSFITLMDTKSMKDIDDIQSVHKGNGIRSLAFNGNILSIGTGAGGLMFYDVRAKKYFGMTCGHVYGLTAGKGWIKRDYTYENYFQDQEHAHAIYTHCLDESKTRIFAAGGPLPAGLWGHYAAVWQ